MEEGRLIELVDVGGKCGGAELMLSTKVSVNTFARQTTTSGDQLFHWLRV